MNNLFSKHVSATNNSGSKRNGSINVESLNFYNLSSMTNRKILFSAFLFIICGISTSFAEDVIDTYSLSYFNKEYDIQSTKIKDGEFSLFIQVSAESASTEAMINVESYDLPAFVSFLTKMKDKYIEWSNVAKENNVTSLAKEMDFQSPSTTICWLGSKWYFAYGIKLKPKFLILDSDQMIVCIYNEVTASSNEYIDESIYWVFSDTKEIDNLISKLNIDKITKRLQEKESANDLFK